MLQGWFEVEGETELHHERQVIGGVCGVWDAPHVVIRQDGVSEFRVFAGDGIFEHSERDEVRGVEDVIEATCKVDGQIGD